jgi:Fic family protein
MASFGNTRPRAPVSRVATIESIDSSTRIEGNKLSGREVERFFSNIEIKKFETRDEQEVAGYTEVIETIFTHADDIDLTENHVRQLHHSIHPA